MNRHRQEWFDNAAWIRYHYHARLSTRHRRNHRRKRRGSTATAAATTTMRYGCAKSAAIRCLIRFKIGSSGFARKVTHESALQIQVLRSNASKSNPALSRGRTESCRPRYGRAIVHYAHSSYSPVSSVTHGSPISGSALIRKGTLFNVELTDQICSNFLHTTG